jgi:hypothetical protein
MLLRVSETGAPRDDDAARAEALFRYRVIAALLDEPACAPLRARVAELASQRHPHPRRGEVAISLRTLWTWLQRFRTGGIDALRPRHRRDRGALRALDAATLDRAEALRRELPARWTSTVLDILVRERSVGTTEAVHRATLDRHLRRRGASSVSVSSSASLSGSALRSSRGTRNPVRYVRDGARSSSSCSA